MILASAPGRAGIIGNPTDMYGGSVVSCSIPQRAYCVVTPSDILSVEVSGIKTVFESPEDYKMTGDNMDIVRAVLTWFDVDPNKFGAKLRVMTEIPEQAGLSGSTAMLVAVMGAVIRQLGIRLHIYDVAETARKIEARVMQITCGYQDQYMVTFGGLNYMEFRDKERLGQRDDEPYAVVERIDRFVPELPLVLGHTGIKRNSDSVHKSIRERWMEGESAVVDGYKRIAEMARLAKKALLEARFDDLGALMNENHAIQRGLGGSGDANEILIDAALESGAYGAKLAGAGKGGTIIALARDKERTVRTLLEAGAEAILYPRPMPGLDVAQFPPEVFPSSRRAGEGAETTAAPARNLAETVQQV